MEEVEPGVESGYVAVARIARTRGRRGEVLADFHTDFPSRFDALEEVWLELAGGRRERIGLEEAWEHGGRLVLKFRGVDTIEAAERYVGAWVEVGAESAVELPEGTYFDHDLVGCSLVGSDGRALGVVRDVVRLAGNHQLLVERSGLEYMVPARAEICKEIAIAQKRIVVDLPEGLIDLNK